VEATFTVQSVLYGDTGNATPSGSHDVGHPRHCVVALEKDTINTVMIVEVFHRIDTVQLPGYLPMECISVQVNQHHPVSL
jgi:hypothetical protein